MFLGFADFLLNLSNLSNLWPNFAGIPPELGVVSKLLKIKCDLIFGCKLYLIFMINDIILES